MKGKVFKIVVLILLAVFVVTFIVSIVSCIKETSESVKNAKDNIEKYKELATIYDTTLHIDHQKNLIKKSIYPCIRETATMVFLMLCCVYFGYITLRNDMRYAIIYSKDEIVSRVKESRKSRLEKRISKIDKQRKSLQEQLDNSEES
jgi:uncharacterized ion transporter superfamily protein YfcC